jgi:hypothetical protein
MLRICVWHCGFACACILQMLSCLRWVQMTNIVVCVVLCLLVFSLLACWCVCVLACLFDWGTAFVGLGCLLFGCEVKVVCLFVHWGVCLFIDLLFVVVNCQLLTGEPGTAIVHCKAAIVCKCLQSPTTEQRVHVYSLGVETTSSHLASGPSAADTLRLVDMAKQTASNRNTSFPIKAVIHMQTCRKRQHYKFTMSLLFDARKPCGTACTAKSGEVTVPSVAGMCGTLSSRHCRILAVHSALFLCFYCFQFDSVGWYCFLVVSIVSYGFLCFCSYVFLYWLVYCVF